MIPRALVVVFLGLFWQASWGGTTDPTLPAGGRCAHRGGGAVYPENTLPALREAVRLGVSMVEFDLALTRDGELVLMHDRTVDRTTNGHGRVSDFTLAQLRQLDAGAWKNPRFAGTRLPTFEEALAVLPRDIWLNIDLKADGRFGTRSADVMRRIATTLVSVRRTHQAVLAARAEDAGVLRAAAPGLLICSMDRQGNWADYVRDAIARRVDFIQLRDCAADPRLADWLRQLKAAGIRINYFFANDPAEVARLLGLGVDFVLVDDLERTAGPAVGLHRGRAAVAAGLRVPES